MDISVLHRIFNKFPVDFSGGQYPYTALRQMNRLPHKIHHVFGNHSQIIPCLRWLQNLSLYVEALLKRLISCEYNMDTSCVELTYTDGTIIALDATAVKKEYAEDIYQRSELD